LAAGLLVFSANPKLVNFSFVPIVDRRLYFLSEMYKGCDYSKNGEKNLIGRMKI